MVSEVTVLTGEANNQKLPDFDLSESELTMELGHEVLTNGVRPDPANTEKVTM